MKAPPALSAKQPGAAPAKSLRSFKPARLRRGAERHAREAFAKLFDWSAFVHL
jgi:hypothetical protein